MRLLSGVSLVMELRLVQTWSQVLSLKSLEANACNLSCWEHGSRDLSLHIGSQVLIPKYDMDAYMATLFGVRLGTRVETWVKFVAYICIIYWTAHTRPKILCIRKSKLYYNGYTSHTSMVSWGSKVGTLTPCWDLRTWVGIGTHGPMWTNPRKQSVQKKHVMRTDVQTKR